MDYYGLVYILLGGSHWLTVIPHCHSVIYCIWYKHIWLISSVLHSDVIDVLISVNYVKEALFSFGLKLVHKLPT